MIRNNEKVQQKKDNTPKGIWGIIALSVILTIIMIISLSFLLDIAGFKSKVMNLIYSPAKKQEKGESHEELQLKRQLKQLENEKAQLKNIEEQLNTLKFQLEAKQKELEQWDLELQHKEKEIDELKDTLSQQYSDIENIAKIYEKMDSEQAAGILSEMSDTDLLIQILKNVSKEKGAEILSLMDAKKAADITNKMVNNNYTERR
jgi:flagellar motility protein MotE (MotC chaperone)